MWNNDFFVLGAVLCGGMVSLGLCFFLIAVGIGIGDKLSGLYRKKDDVPDCVLTPEQKQFNDNISDEDDVTEPYVPEHEWDEWKTHAKTDGQSSVIIQARRCKICGFIEHKTSKLKYK